MRPVSQARVAPPSRRALLRGVATLAGASFMGKADAMTKPLRLGVQLYMLGKIEPADMPATLEALSKIGYREVEASPLPGLPAEAFRAALDKAGLSCPSCHIGLEAAFPGTLSLEEPAGAIAYAKAVGATALVTSTFPFLKTLLQQPDGQAALGDMSKVGAALVSVGHAMTAEDWTHVARRMNAAGARLAAEGLRVGYHNHNVEFVQLAGGRTAFDVLIAETDPKLVDFELDIGWAVAAGQDPAALLKRHAGRITQVHLKDLAPTPSNTSLRIKTAEVGRGVQDWPAVMAAIHAASVEHLYVEQEPPYAVSGLRSAADAFAFLAPRLSSAKA